MKLFHLCSIHERKGKSVVDLKKRLAIILIIIFFITVSCVVHDTERPFNYPPTKWISDTPDVSFRVSDENYNERVGDTSKYILDGNLNLDGESIELDVYFNPGSYAYFFDKNNSSHLGIGDDGKFDYLLFKGDCKFGPEKLVVTIDKKTDKAFGGKFSKITFERIAEATPTPTNDDTH